MGVWTYEEYRLRQQQIEVKALTALAQFGNEHQVFEALKHLEVIAYPEITAEEISEDPLVFDGQEHDIELTLQCLGELLEEGTIEEVNRLDGRIGYRVVSDDDEDKING